MRSIGVYCSVYKSVEKDFVFLIMNKKVLGGLIQYSAALLAVVLTVFYIVAYNNGALPFSSKEPAPRPDTNAPVDVSSPAPEISEEKRPITATEFLASLATASDADTIDVGLYNGAQLFLRRSASTMGDLSGAELYLQSGCIYKKSADGTVSVFDSYMRDVTEVLAGAEHTMQRDANGHPLFFKDGKYYYLQNGVLVEAYYDAVNFDKGVEYYPSYLAGGSNDYTVFGSDRGYGLRRNSDGAVVIKAEYADVYIPSEGYAIAVDNKNKMYLFSTEGALITSDYSVPSIDAESMTGYFFVKNGLFRACDDNGKELLVNTDGVAVPVPSDYSIVSYSDGVALLKGADGRYGYFATDGEWLGKPYYEDAKPFYEGLAAVRYDGLYGMIDTKGNLVIPCVFDSLSDCRDGVVVGFTQKNGYCVLNKIIGNVE